MTEMPSKHWSGNRPSQDQADTRDTRETIGLFYNRKTYLGTYIYKVWEFSHVNYFFNYHLYYYIIYIFYLLKYFLKIWVEKIVAMS